VPPHPGPPGRGRQWDRLRQGLIGRSRSFAYPVCNESKPSSRVLVRRGGTPSRIATGFEPLDGGYGAAP
jgi:hypothetical protein